MTSVRGGRLALIAVVVALLLGLGVVAALERPGVEEPVDRSTSSSPFSVGRVPDRYEPVLAGAGGERPAWGDDSFGTNEPTTVLAPDGEAPTASSSIVVSVTGYAGYQDGLHQAVPALREDTQSFVVDGHEALFAPADPDGPASRSWADLVVALDDDLAVRITAVGLERDELAGIVRRVRPRGRTRPPLVDPPEGYRVVAAAGPVLDLALYPRVVEREGGGPGPVGAHGVGWTAPDGELVVLTLPGTSGDPDVLLSERMGLGDVLSTTRVGVSGRRGIVLRTQIGGCDSACEEETTLVTTTAWGDVLVVHSRGAEPLGADALTDVAASVEAVDEAAWEAFVVEAAGGPTLVPDGGMVEVARGVEGGVEWLLQSYANGPDRDGLAEGITTDVVPTGTYVTDGCLKLATRQRVCTSGGSFVDGLILRLTNASPGAEAGAPDLPGFVIVDTVTEAAGLRIRTTDQDVTAPMHRLPGEDARWAGVAFVDDPEVAPCPDGPASPEDGGAGVVGTELVDATGAPVRCVGL